MDPLKKRFRLASEPGSLGLLCDESGLTLAGVPLLRQSDLGHLPRSKVEIEALIGGAYPSMAGRIQLSSKLTKVAAALNRGDFAGASLAALLLRLPQLDWNAAVRITQANDLLSKYDPMEPRDWHGRWTVGDDGIPPGPEIDLLTDVAYQGFYHDQVVKWLSARLKHLGSTVEASVPLTLIGGETTAVADLVVRPIGAPIYIIEVKTGKNPYLTENQSVIYAGALIGEHIFSPSPKIRAFGLQPFEPLPPIPVWIARVPHPGAEMHAFQVTP